MKKKKVILISLILVLVAAMCFHLYLFNNEYQSYKLMYEKGKVTGTTFLDCEHTREFPLDYSSSMATREPVAVSSEKLKEIHPTVLSYMFCCGHIQEKLGVWLLQEAIIVVPLIIVLCLVIREKKKQSGL